MLIDNEYATLTVTGYEGNDGFSEEGGYTLHMFLLNKTDSPVLFGCSRVKLNGIENWPIYNGSGFTLDAGRSEFITVTWFQDSLESRGISDVESLEFVFGIYHQNDAGSYEKLMEETPTWNP